MFNEEVERIILFSIIFEEADYEIAEEDFINSRNKMIAKAIIELRKNNEKIGMFEVQSKIKRNKTDVINYLAELSNNLYGLDREKSYEELRNLSKKRKLYQLVNESKVQIEESEDISLYAQKLVDEINSIVKEEVKETSFYEKVIETTKEIENNWKNRNNFDLYTGILDLDKKTCGLHRQELTIIGARPRTRKDNINTTNSRKNSK